MVTVTRDFFHWAAVLFMGAMPSFDSFTDVFSGDSNAFFKRSFPGFLIGSGERTAMHKLRGLRHPRLAASVRALPSPWATFPASAVTVNMRSLGRNALRNAGQSSASGGCRSG